MQNRASESVLILHEQSRAQLQLLSAGHDQHYCHSWERPGREAKLDHEQTSSPLPQKHTHTPSPHFSKHHFSSSHWKQKRPIVPRTESWHMPLKMLLQWRTEMLNTMWVCVSRCSDETWRSGQEGRTFADVRFFLPVSPSVCWGLELQRVFSLAEFLLATRRD